MPLDHPKSAFRSQLNFSHQLSSVAPSYGTGIEIRKERPLLPEGILTAGREASVSEATGLCIQMQLDHPKSARR